jgi:hypothetical protein
MMKFLCVMILAVLIPFGGVSAEIQDVESRGAITRLLVEQGDNPWVTVVLFAGGKGALKLAENGAIGWGGRNFLVRSREYFQDRGAITAVIDAPTDHRDKLYGFRVTEDHAKDIGAVIKHLRAKYGLPVWLVGTSRGTTSVASAAVRLQQEKPDGIVLTSTMLVENTKGDYVLPLELSKIEIPVLIAHHKYDACAKTPPGKVGDLKAALTMAKPVKVLWYEKKGYDRGSACQARHYHGFIDIEEKVVSDIMAWIKAPKP